MRLPGHENAFIDIKKLRDYCLNPRHPVGKHKARVFKSVLGFDKKDANRLKEIILKSLEHNKAVKKYEDRFGTRFEVPIPIDNSGKYVIIITIWMVPVHNTRPHLVTCYIKT